MINIIRKMGVSSSALYAMGFGSIGMSIVSWTISKKTEAAGTDRADRWGIFVGQWAPTFFALGTAMRLEERWGPHGRHEEVRESEREREDRSAREMPVA